MRQTVVGRGRECLRATLRAYPPSIQRTSCAGRPAGRGAGGPPARGGPAMARGPGGRRPRSPGRKPGWWGFGDAAHPGGGRPRPHGLQPHRVAGWTLSDLYFIASAAWSSPTCCGPVRSAGPAVAREPPRLIGMRHRALTAGPLGLPRRSARPSDRAGGPRVGDPLPVLAPCARSPAGGLTGYSRLRWMLLLSGSSPLSVSWASST